MISLFDKSRPVLVLSPHPDDAELGCGGTIARLCADGFTVHIVHMSLWELGEEAMASALKLGASCVWVSSTAEECRPKVREFPKVRQQLLEHFVRLRDTYNPGCIFTPATTDVHQDHQTVTEEAYRAFRHRTILGYYEPWNTPKMEPSVFVTLSGEMVRRKLEALEQYQSQRHRLYFGEASQQAILRMWGLQCATTWAESFELVRGVVI